jgi:hypothetical protein
LNIRPRIAVANPLVVGTASRKLLLGALGVALALAGCGSGLHLGPLHLYWGDDPLATFDADPDTAPPRAWLDASDVPHVSVFYDALAPWGVWEEDAAFGWVWRPSDPTYAPYARGRWVDTEAGPTFLEDSAFGWAVAHYGRWMWRGSWLWVPGVRWGPAWVEWRVGPDLVGWSPLSPDGWSRTKPEAAWHFVATRDFHRPLSVVDVYATRDVPWLVSVSRNYARKAADSRFVVGPEVRYAGWSARRVPLSRLPSASIRWIPRWERPHAGLMTGSSTRAGPAGPDRFGRKAPVLPTRWRPHRRPR